VRTVEGSGFLAQASLSRLGEISSTRPICLCELSLKRRAPVLRESTSRSGEEVSPKRECVTAPLFPFSSPRLGEVNLPERDSSALARS